MNDWQSKEAAATYDGRLLFDRHDTRQVRLAESMYQGLDVFVGVEIVVFNAKYHVALNGVQVSGRRAEANRVAALAQVDGHRDPGRCVFDVDGIVAWRGCDRDPGQGGP